MHCKFGNIQGASAIVGEWSEVIVENADFGGNVLPFSAFNTASGGFPGNIDYTFYLDDLRAEWKPVIQGMPEGEIAMKKYTEVSLGDLGITATDRDTGKAISVSYVVEKSNGEKVELSAGNTFLLEEYGNYTVTVNAVSAKGNIRQQSFIIKSE